MNLPTLAVILEDHTLSKIYGGAKVVHLVNSHLTDETQKININMTGREVNDLYKTLDYPIQLQLLDMDMFDESETNIIVNQVELLNSTTDSAGNMNRTVKELMVMFAATLMLITAIVICLGYYENSRQNDTLVDSKLFSLLNHVVNKFYP